MAKQTKAVGKKQSHGTYRMRRKPGSKYVRNGMVKR